MIPAYDVPPYDDRDYHVMVRVTRRALDSNDSDELFNEVVEQLALVADEILAEWERRHV